MRLTLNRQDFSKLSQSAQREIMHLLLSRNEDVIPPGFDVDAFKHVARLSPEQIEEFMERCSESTKKGLRLFAIHGPCIDAEILKEADIEDYSRFQSGVTKRTRTVTGDENIFFFTWDDWPSHENGIGRYLITYQTYTSLREYFKIIN